MSRMLNALKQLEGRRPAAWCAPVEACPEESRPDVRFVQESDPYAIDYQGATPSVPQYAEPIPAQAVTPVWDDATLRSDPVAAAGTLPLRFTGDDYTPLARRIVELIDRDACHSFLLHSVNVETDDLVSISTLGRALAGELGRRVLLIHTNRRLQSIVDGVPQGPLPGLTECLFAGAAWESCVHRTSHPALDLVPRGESAFRGGQIAELQFPGCWRGAYGAVLIGTAPHSQQLALDLSTASDATIVAVKLRSIDGQALQRTAASLRSAGARLAGCVALD
jgi:hypothetical protein